MADEKDEESEWESIDSIEANENGFRRVNQQSKAVDPLDRLKIILERKEK